jgi:hypothetical protein
MRTVSPGEFDIGMRGAEQGTASPEVSVANAAFRLIFPCYSRNFTSVTFSLHRDELALC